MERRLVGGHPVEMDMLGEGVPVLMLHGFPIDRHSLMRSVGPVFERRTGYRRIHVDLPGFGASPAVPEIDSSETMVEFVTDLIDDLVGDEPMLIVGESWGGYLARGVIARRAAQVLGVALIVPVVIATHAERDVPEHRILFEQPGLFEEADRVEVDDYLATAVIADRDSWEYARSVFGPAVAAADPTAVERIESRYAFALDVDEVGEAFSGPSLIVVGRQDSVVGYRDAVRLIERFPRATFAVLDAAGHHLEAERPRLLADLVDDWLDRVERS